MADTPQKLQLAFESFSRDFVLPMARGGAVRVGRPLGPGAVAHFVHARPADTDLELAIAEAWLALAADVVPVRATPYPNSGAIGLLVALHNLLAVTDPRLAPWPGRRARPQVLRWVDQLLASVSAPHSREGALARHAAIGRIFELARDDVVVHTWAYTHRFSGRLPPPRLVAWRTVRRVREDASRVPWDQLLGFTYPPTDAAEPVDAWIANELPRRVGALLVASPLTDLLTCARPSPQFLFGPASCTLLADPVLRTGVAQTLLVAGLGRCAVPLGGALLALIASGAPPAAVGVVLRFLYELHVLAVVDRGESDKEPPVDRVTPESAAFLAVLPAVAVSPCEIAAELPLERPDDAELRVRSALLARMAGDDMVQLATSLLGYAAGGPLPDIPKAPQTP